MDSIKVVTGVIGADIHCIGLRILEHALRKSDIEVVSLGIMVSQKEFIEAAIESNADAILISSLYGLGLVDVDGLRDNCIESGIGDILLYIGGNLSVGETVWSHIEKSFLDIGFSRVFSPQVPLEDCIRILRQDVRDSREKIS